MQNNKLTDEELIKKFQNGDRNAFNSLVVRYKDKLQIYINTFMRDEHVSENLLQDTFMKLYTHGHTYKEVAKFSTWIYTIAGNLAKTELRKYKRRKTYNVSGLGKEDQEFVMSRPEDDHVETDEDNKVSKKLIEDSGGHVRSTVSSNTNCVIAGENAGGKLTKAKELKIKIINEKELQTLLSL